MLTASRSGIALQGIGVPMPARTSVMTMIVPVCYTGLGFVRLCAHQPCAQHAHQSMHQEEKHTYPPVLVMLLLLLPQLVAVEDGMAREPAEGARSRLIIPKTCSLSNRIGSAIA